MASAAATRSPSGRGSPGTSPGEQSRGGKVVVVGEVEEVVVVEVVAIEVVVAAGAAGVVVRGEGADAPKGEHAEARTAKRTVAAADRIRTNRTE